MTHDPGMQFFSVVECVTQDIRDPLEIFILGYMGGSLGDSIVACCAMRLHVSACM